MAIGGKRPWIYWAGRAGAFCQALSMAQPEHGWRSDWPVIPITGIILS